MKPILCSLDLNKNSLIEIMNSLGEIKDSHFDGVELCLWEDMNKYSSIIRNALETHGLIANVHGDIMRSAYGFYKCEEILNYGIRFSKNIGAKHFITHPIKPYAENKNISKRLLNNVKDHILVENVKDITFDDLDKFSKNIVFDIGNAYRNNNFPSEDQANKINWTHIHDYNGELDHLALGIGKLDIDKFVENTNTGMTIELGRTFRRWSEHKKDHLIFIDAINNILIKNGSYGKNVRLINLKKSIGNCSFETALELGCDQGYLLHNIPAIKKYGFDLNPKETFNEITYRKIDLNNPIILPMADIIICSEVIEHIQNDYALINTMYNSLKKGGKLFLTTINKNTGEDKTAKDLERGHLRRYTPQLKQILETAGFITEKFYSIRSDHYYQNKPQIDTYSMEKDIQEGNKNASGWVYLGVK